MSYRRINKTKPHPTRPQRTHHPNPNQIPRQSTNPNPNPPSADLYVFINRVANYIGENPVIKNLFIEKYREHFPKFNGGIEPTAEQIAKAQGYYFANTSQGQFTDSEGGQKEQKRIYDLILKDKKTLLSLDNPVEFIFSHSALGVGWDNPNVFQIATLSTTYSEIKKRQEIGCGLRICVDQTGKRIYDSPDV